MRFARILVAAALASGFFAVACHKEGPAEQAGEKIDKAASNVGDKMEDMGDKLRDKVHGD